MPRASRRGTARSARAGSLPPAARTSGKPRTPPERTLAAVCQPRRAAYEMRDSAARQADTAAWRLCRYVSRPPVAEERLALTPTGHVRYTLKTPYRDGTTHVVVEPLDFIARLAALVPPPRIGAWVRRSIRPPIQPSHRHRGTWRWTGRGGAYSPQTQRLIVNVNAAPFVAQLVRGTAAGTKQDHPVAGQKTMHVTMQGTPYTLAVGPLLSPLGIPCTAPPWEKLVAVDLAHGRIAWEAPARLGARDGSVPAALAHQLGHAEPWRRTGHRRRLVLYRRHDGPAVPRLRRARRAPALVARTADRRHGHANELCVARPAVRADQCRWARDVQPRYRRLPDRLRAPRRSAGTTRRAAFRGRCGT